MSNEPGLLKKKTKKERKKEIPELQNPILTLDHRKNTALNPGLHCVPALPFPWHRGLCGPWQRPVGSVLLLESGRTRSDEVINRTCTSGRRSIEGLFLELKFNSPFIAIYKSK